MNCIARSTPTRRNLPEPPRFVATNLPPTPDGPLIPRRAVARTPTREGLHLREALLSPPPTSSDRNTDVVLVTAITDHSKSSGGTNVTAHPLGEDLSRGDLLEILLVVHRARSSSENQHDTRVEDGQHRSWRSPAMQSHNRRSPRLVRTGISHRRRGTTLTVTAGVTLPRRTVRPAVPTHHRRGPTRSRTSRAPPWSLSQPPTIGGRVVVSSGRRTVSKQNTRNKSLAS